MQIGRYEVLSELGQGGMAVVYLAQDPLVKRQVAIKVLPRQLTMDPQFRSRFLREAEVIAGLEHPAIVPVYDYGDADDQPYIVMRYMPGGSLADRMLQGPLSLTEIARLFQRLSGAVDAAHQRGIVHRDLKPGNILFDQWGEAYLSDFGIVKLAEGTSRFTGTGLIGTPAYMSPEQARGKGSIDGRSDVYSLAVILFELLTNQLPYEADTPMGLAVAHIIQPVPEILKTNPSLPKESDTILKKSMAKDPDHRYQSASEFAVAVSSLAGVTFTPPPPPKPVVPVGAGQPPVKPPTPRPSALLADEPSETLRPGDLMAGRDIPLPNKNASRVMAAPPEAPPTRRSSRSIFALTGAAGFIVLILGAVVCVGGAFAVSRMLTTATPSATATHANTATPTLTATHTATRTATATVTETTPPTEAATPTITPTNTRIPFSPTPTLTPTPVCNPPEYYNPELDRCWVDQPSDGGGNNGGGDGGGNNNPPPPTSPPASTPPKGPGDITS